MEVKDFSKLNFSVGLINNLLKKAEESITLNESKDAARLLIAAATESINKALQALQDRVDDLAEEFAALLNPKEDDEDILTPSEEGSDTPDSSGETPEETNPSDSTLEKGNEDTEETTPSSPESEPDSEIIPENPSEENSETTGDEETTE